MTVSTTLSPEAIRQARCDDPKSRERDLALRLGITEAGLVAAHCGHGAQRIEPRVSDLLSGMEALGEVMALTRNESAVHEKIGVYDKVVAGGRNAMVLGADIDLRIFPSVWRHGFAVEKVDGDATRRSLQFFDEYGDAVHKIHLRPTSDIAAYENLVHTLWSENQAAGIAVDEKPAGQAVAQPTAQADDLRAQWSAMTDVHQFHGMLRNLQLSRHQAVGMVGDDYAWRIDDGAVPALFAHAAQEQIPIMCFVGNRGCIQIHSGPVEAVKSMGPWINVLDPTFHLHLRTDHISQVWVVRKPVSHVTSVEVYDGAGSMIIQFFGQRKEGRVEREDWRMIAENLPRIHHVNVA